MDVKLSPEEMQRLQNQLQAGPESQVNCRCTIDPEVIKKAVEVGRRMFLDPDGPKWQTAFTTRSSRYIALDELLCAYEAGQAIPMGMVEQASTRAQFEATMAKHDEMYAADFRGIETRMMEYYVENDVMMTRRMTEQIPKYNGSAIGLDELAEAMQAMEDHRQAVYMLAANQAKWEQDVMAGPEGRHVAWLKTQLEKEGAIVVPLPQSMYTSNYPDRVIWHPLWRGFAEVKGWKTVLRDAQKVMLAKLDRRRKGTAVVLRARDETGTCGFIETHTGAIVGSYQSGSELLACLAEYERILNLPAEVAGEKTVTKEDIS